MRIGLTYDLRSEYLAMGFTEEETAEFDSEETVERLGEAIAGLGHDVDRIGNVYELARRLVAGQKWDLVFNIAEGLHGRSREAHVPALLEAYGMPFTFSDPLTLALSLDKAMAKRILRHSGVPTPAFWVVESVEEAGELGFDFALEEFPLFLKPNCEGTGKGVSPDSIVRDMGSFASLARKLLVRYRQPILVEQYLPGREFTVGVLGTGREARVAGVMEVVLLGDAEPAVYSFKNKELCERLVKYSLVNDKGIFQEASKVALDAYRVLGVRDAGRVDLRADRRGRLHFLEINPLPGLHPTHSDLPILCRKAGLSYERLIGEIIGSALGRAGKGRRAQTADAAK
jgi:D-alanine-D-alanine ligase